MLTFTPVQQLSLAICVIGMLIYLLVPREQDRVVRVGEIMFAIGLFCVLWGK